MSWLPYVLYTHTHTSAFHCQMQSNVLHHIIAVHICYLSVLLSIVIGVVLLDWLWMCINATVFGVFFWGGVFCVYTIHVLHCTSHFVAEFRLRTTTLYMCFHSKNKNTKEKKHCVQLTMLLTHHLQWIYNNCTGFHFWLIQNGTKIQPNQSQTNHRTEKEHKIFQFTTTTTENVWYTHHTRKSGHKWKRLSSRYDKFQKKVNKRSKLYFLSACFFFLRVCWKRKSS